MKRRSSLFALWVLVLALACDNSQSPTGPSAPIDPSSIISDGAHGGNRDFFFLPPLVPLPTVAQGFEAGEFNNDLQPSLSVEICRLKPDKLDNEHLPTPATPCYENGPFYNFPAGTVQLVNNPGASTGWWTSKSLPSDGFYYVQWDTRPAHLNAEKFYRVKVFLSGLTEPLGVLDIDPMKKASEFQAARVGDVVQVMDGAVLPIAFRLENGALCGGATLCTSETVTNTGGTVTVDGGGGAAIAGAKFPPNWLPVGPGRPTSVVVTIAEVAGAATADGTRTIPCHAGLPFQQFDKCFKFTTIPELTDITPGRQFAQDVTVAVCYTLLGGQDPRREYAELYASDVGEPPHALEEKDDAGILSADARDCTPEPVIGLGPETSNPLTRLARAMKGGLANLFAVKTAYAIDGGLGGIVKGFSNIGPAITAHMENFTPAERTLGSGVFTTVAQVRIVGSHVHVGEGAGDPAGIDKVPVTFTVTSGNGTLSPVNGELSVPVVSDTSSTLVIDGEGATFIEGVASVAWTVPSVPGDYTMTATGPTDESVTFTVTVPANVQPDFVVTLGNPAFGPSEITTGGGTIELAPWLVTNQGGNFSFEPTVVVGFYLSTDATITTADTYIGSVEINPGLLQAGESYYPDVNALAIPEQAAGTYYVGILADSGNRYAESNEANNFASAPLTVTAAVNQFVFISAPVPAASVIADVWVQRVDGTGQKQLTSGAGGELRPRWSPTGSRILFNRAGNLYTINPDDAEPIEQLFVANADQGYYSPDGTKIVFTRGFRLWEMNADGTNEVQLEVPTGAESVPSYGPDNSILFAGDVGSQRNIYRRAPTGVVTQLTTDGGSNYPSYSPDGSKILFMRGQTVYMMNADGSVQAPATTNETVNGASVYPTWSPNGLKIIFSVLRSGQNEIYIMNRDGTGATNITNSPLATESYPSIRPGNH